jgi:hypothetical protein
VVPAETSGQVKRKRKSQLCDDHHRFENGARFEGLVFGCHPGTRRPRTLQTGDKHVPVLKEHAHLTFISPADGLRAETIPSTCPPGTTK